jgi:hypothetical protein
MRIHLLLVVALLVVSRDGALAKTYKNTTFGLQVELPSGSTVCTADEGESDRGFSILWKSRICPHDDDIEGIYVDVRYNALNRRSTLDTAKDECVGLSAKPSPFMVAGFRFFRCLLRTDRGRIVPTWFVLRNRRLSSPDNGVIYGVTLICPRNDCRKLRPLVRWVFSHMKFIEQD